MAERPDLSVVIFTRDDAPLLRRCLASLQAVSGVLLDVIVVDNASRDDTEDAAKAVRCLRLSEDSAFSVGNNRGLAMAKAPATLFLNPDTEVGEDALRLCLAALDDPSVGLVSPRLRWPDGSDQETGWALPTPRQLVAERVGGAARWTAPAGDLTDVGWLMGCFLLGRTMELRTLGGFDEAFWFHGTDLELCARVHDSGQRVVRVEGASILHVGHRGWDRRRRRATRRATAQWLRRDHGPLVGAAARVLA